MLRFLLLAACGLLLAVAGHAQAAPTYMQIFYEGAGWLAGRPVLHYSPAFRGKTGELVREDSTKILSPGAFMFAQPAGEVTVTEGSTTTYTNGVATTYVRGKDGKVHPQTAAEARQAQASEAARFNRQLDLAAARAALARTALTNALNAAAADGWEVVQLAQWGGKDGLVYLLRRR